MARITVLTTSKEQKGSDLYVSFCCMTFVVTRQDPIQAFPFFPSHSFGVVRFPNPMGVGGAV